jgi:ABC-type amino acid transport substrate-binding protein
VPRTGLDQALVNGDVDGICYAMPKWLGVSLNWSSPLIQNENLLVSATNVSAVRSISEADGKRLGVVYGYKYPELTAVLGPNFARDNSPTMPLNIKKLLVGRYRYAVIDKLSLDYQAKSTPELRTLATYAILKFTASCAFSPASKIPFSEVNQAIEQLVKEGVVERILAQYR